MSGGKIDRVAEVANSAKQRSAQVLKASQQAHHQKCDQLEQLQQFKREYESRLEVMGGQGIAARQLQDYRQFLSKLNQAIEQQKEEVQSAARDMETSREAWVSGSRRSSALDQVVEQQKRRQKQARDRAEQKESDELTLARGAGPAEG